MLLKIKLWWARRQLDAAADYEVVLLDELHALRKNDLPRLEREVRRLEIAAGVPEDERTVA